jgi:hypothetical protein
MHLKAQLSELALSAADLLLDVPLVPGPSLTKTATAPFINAQGYVRGTKDG